MECFGNYDKCSDVDTCTISEKCHDIARYDKADQIRDERITRKQMKMCELATDYIRVGVNDIDIPETVYENMTVDQKVSIQLYAEGYTTAEIASVVRIDQSTVFRYISIVT